MMMMMMMMMMMKNVHKQSPTCVPSFTYETAVKCNLHRLRQTT
jgi:hypothetical protein